MDMIRRPGDERLEVARVLVLLQGSILLVTAMEAVIWGAAFGAGGAPALLSATAASILLVARLRLRADRRWTRRLVFVVEGVVLVTLALDTALALAIARSTPPLVAIITRLVLPVAVIALLRRSDRRSASVAPALAEGGS